ncbi:MAG TPA: rhodanese-like domain-containing protein [Acidimicrobiales bacterium]|nr:rhodanese-like domain-containing protein [Acidimicrobiales bacterium]
MAGNGVESGGLQGEMCPDEVRARLVAGEDLFFLDVREVDEVAEWAFPHGVNIPMSELGARTAELPTDRVIVVACRSGRRSRHVADVLNSAGWTAVNLTGGALAWVASESAGSSAP